MKFHIDKHVLLKPLNQVARALPGKSIIEILNGIFIQANEEGLTLTAGDTATSIRASIPPEDFQLDRAGSIVLPGKKFIDIVQKAPDDISIEMIEKMQARIQSGRSKFELSGLDADEYPAFNSGGGSEIVIAGDVLKSLISKTVFAIAEEKAGTPILTGVHFEIEEGKMSLTSTNRHRLARVSHNIETTEPASVVVKGECLSELLKLIDSKDELRISFYGNKFTAKTEDFTFVSSILEGTFPDLARTIPVDFNSIVTVSTKKLFDVMDRVLIVATEEKTNQVNITIGDEVLIESKASSGFNASESLEIVSLIGEGFQVAVNAKYVYEALKTIDSEEVSINYIKSLHPIVFKELRENQDIQLILPYRTV